MRLERRPVGAGLRPAEREVLLDDAGTEADGPNTAVADSVWSDRPIGTRQRRAMSGMVRRSISPGDAG